MSEKFIEKYKSEILITTGFVVIASLLGGIYYIKNNEPVPMTQEDYVSYKMPDNIMTVTDDGLVNLYNNQSELIKSVDLRDFLGVPLEEVKPELIPEPKPELTPEPEPPKQEIIETPKLYEDFVVVQVTIKDKDISWNIQSKLTPNRKIEDMIKLDEKLNKDSVLHPIYPGDTRLYLKEKDCTENILGETVVMDARESELISNEAITSITESEEEKPKEEIQEKKEEELNTNTIDYKYADVNFVYSTSNDISKIFVYNDFNNVFMEISMEDKEINVKPILKTDKYYDIDDFKIENDNVYAISKTNKQIYKFTKEPLNNVTKSVDYEIKDWALYDDKIYLISENTEDLEMFNMNKEEDNDDVYTLNLGDKNMGIEIVDNNLYILNNFGSQKNNNVVHKFNPKNLASEGWVELEDINNTLIKSASTEKMVLLEKDSITSSKNETKETLVSVKENKNNKLIKDEMVINGLRAEDSIVKENLLYEKVENKINLKSVTRLENVGTIDIKNEVVFVPIFDD